MTRRRLLHYGVAVPASFKYWMLQISSRDVIDQLSEMIPRLMERHRVPGLSVSVIRDAEILWSQGFGVKSTETNETVTSDTIFEAASLSKPAFAYAALRFFETDERHLDIPLTEYVPESFIKGEARINFGYGAPSVVAYVWFASRPGVGKSDSTAIYAWVEIRLFRDRHAVYAVCHRATDKETSSRIDAQQSFRALRNDTQQLRLA